MWLSGVLPLPFAVPVCLMTCAVGAVQTAATGFTHIHQGGMFIAEGGVIGVDAGRITSNSGLTISAGGSLLFSDEKV
jgi:hypothetical protein